jgi:hypothetical protein
MITKKQFNELTEALRDQFDEEYDLITELQIMKEILYHALESTSIECDITLEDIARKF